MIGGAGSGSISISKPTVSTYAQAERDNIEFAFEVIGDLNGGEREGIFDIALDQIRLPGPDSPYKLPYSGGKTGEYFVFYQFVSVATYSECFSNTCDYLQLVTRPFNRCKYIDVNQDRTMYSHKPI